MVKNQSFKNIIKQLRWKRKYITPIWKQQMTTNGRKKIYYIGKFDVTD